MCAIVRRWLIMCSQVVLELGLQKCGQWVDRGTNARSALNTNLLRQSSVTTTEWFLRALPSIAHLKKHPVIGGLLSVLLHCSLLSVDNGYPYSAMDVSSEAP